MKRGNVHFFILFLMSFSAIEATHAKKYGLADLEEYESLHLENHANKVVEVHFNSLGRERISAGASDLDLSVLDENEFITMKISSNEAEQMIPFQATLPSSVNNSLLPSFPPIGDQGRIGSCVAWGSTYYQAAHEIGLLNGINNQKGGKGLLSPKWTYDLLNNGTDQGLSVLSAYQLLTVHGAPSFQSFPYDTNYTAWALDPEDWIEAINNRMAGYALIPGLGGSKEQNLTAIKTALVNGHILTFATFIDSWVFTKIQRDPENINNNYMGEYAATYMNGMKGGHFMTLVGYDDNLWIDVNGNGAVDAGERGAFLIANSWGTSWGNRGFIWISYDAFLNNSAVVNGPYQNRVAAGIYLNSSVIMAVPKAKNYSPSLIAQFSLTQSHRNQIAVQGGISEASHTAPTITFANYGLTNQGGALGFSGKSPGIPETMTFALDFTDLLSSIPSSTVKRYYLTVGDNAVGAPTQLNSYTLIDLVHKNQISASNLPQIYDNTLGTVFLDYDFTQETVPIPVPLSVEVVAPENNTTLNGTVIIKAEATNSPSLANVQLFVDSVFVAAMTESSGLYTTSLDTTKFTNDSHELTVVVADTSNNTSKAVVKVQFLNESSLPSFFIDVGGPIITSQGHTWMRDREYLLEVSRVHKTNYVFDNPVYQTARSGNMTYQFDVPNGEYLVTLKFAEISYSQPNQRIFDVNINDVPVIQQLDLANVAGKNVAHDQTFPVTVTDGFILIRFNSLVNRAQINAIEISPVH